MCNNFITHETICQHIFHLDMQQQENHAWPSCCKCFQYVQPSFRQLILSFFCVLSQKLLTLSREPLYCHENSPWVSVILQYFRLRVPKFLWHQF